MVTEKQPIFKDNYYIKTTNILRELEERNISIYQMQPILEAIVILRQPILETIIIYIEVT